jgi:hypothetical protein
MKNAYYKMFLRNMKSKMCHFECNALFQGHRTKNIFVRPKLDL